LENLAPERRAALAKLRSLVFEVASDAVETMKYRYLLKNLGHNGNLGVASCVCIV
jgi:uncharacterized protein YdhG (YjbR/CyaY superfamily)